MTGLFVSPALACDGRVVTSENLVGGPICVPSNPERVIALDPFYTLLMAGELGLPVIGTALSGAELPDGARSLFDNDPVVVGQILAPDLEVILSLNPDLILGDAYAQAEIYGQLKDIAPTALINTSDWKTYFLTLGAAAGATQQVEDKLAIYSQKVSEAAQKIPDNMTVSFLRIVPGGFQVYVAGPAAYSPMSILTELGINRPPFETVTDNTVLKRPTLEGLLDLQGDVLIYTIGGAHHDGDAEALEREVTSHPIWQALPAVKAGRVFRVEPNHWMNFGGLRSAEAIVEDVVAIFDQLK